MSPISVPTSPRPVFNKDLGVQRKEGNKAARLHGTAKGSMADRRSPERQSEKVRPD